MARFSKILLCFEKNMPCFRASLNVALEWYITFLTKQWCKALKGVHGKGGALKGVVNKFCNTGVTIMFAV